ncbi:MAG: biotin--[acetyl-CoA-carboxylase] ligase [Prolixibacteraceae bacterium]|jgi:BirA family biotin operon repressor/biotin-[acetyl-CoA-carboxylase] ligase|nr:biotin--[acetyl-CoA-carboxylase] ligase [Prolixibacteraceae bacterium]
MAEIIGRKIIKLSGIDSTNNYATKIAGNSNIVEGTLVLANEQFSGRGQVNNIWESEAGANVLVSIVFYPVFLPVHHQFMLSKIVSLGVAGCVSDYTGGVKVKWPNDIYVGEKKVAGILIENSIMGMNIGWSVAGIGINVNQNVFRSNAPNPVSLAQLTGRKFHLPEVVNKLCDHIDKWYKFLKEGDDEAVNSAYINSLYRFGTEAAFSDNEGSYRGTITGVNEIGQLQIRKTSGALSTYHFKEVIFL